MSKGAQLDEIGSLGITPLVAAVRCQDPPMIDLLCNNGAIKYIGDDRHLSSLLEAASDAGDVQWLEFLIQLGGEVKPQHLGHALTFVIWDGHDEAAEKLVKAGAELDFIAPHPSTTGPPLWEALKRRNERMIRLLLDSAASPGYGLSNGYNRIEPPAVLAA